jgi:hypothetical protein
MAYPHCKCHGMVVRHGFSFGFDLASKTEITRARRLFCNKRGARGGCGRTIRCPHCGEMRATVDPRNKLAHCFDFSKNLNNIDLHLTLGYDFRAAVAVLERLLDRFDKLQGKRKEAAT